MGDRRSWGDRFAQWLTALPTGKKFVVSLGLVLSAIVPAGQIVEAVAALVWGSGDQSGDQTVHITCGDREVERTFSKEELEVKSGDVQSLVVEMCTA